MAEEKKNELETVLDFVDVAGYKIKPWGLLALRDLSPHIERVITGLQVRGVKLDDVRTGKGIEKVIFSILPECADIVAITLKIPLAEVDKIDIKDLPLILMTIAKTNMEYLKNSFGPIMDTVRKVAD